MKLSLYAITIFLSSALLLALEIVAGRLIAPYVGVSLYTWTAVIGIILAGLSIGNWLGGVWADNGADEKSAAFTLLGASIASFTIPLLITIVAPSIQTYEMSLLTASLFLVLTLFFIPAVLLGVVTPLLTTLALKLSNRTGHIVGMMHALAAVGSIFGTFITGYWLIQYFGTRSVVLGTAAVLAILAIPLLKGKKLSVTLPAVLVVFSVITVVTTIRNGFEEPCLEESQYFCIRIVEEPWSMPVGKVKSMILDHLLHGSNHDTQPALLVSPYVHLMDEMISVYFSEKADLSLFFIGGGAYTLPRAIQKTNPLAKISVAELDPEVTMVAERDLNVDTSSMNIFHTDARLQLEKDENIYDVIIGDAFHDIAIPPHLVTQEMAKIIKSKLTNDGLYVLNVVDAFPDSKMVIAIMQTLKSQFKHVEGWLNNIPNEKSRVTYVISASDRTLSKDIIRSQKGPNRQWFNVTTPLDQVKQNIGDIPLLTDDYAPIESLMSSLFTTEIGI